MEKKGWIEPAATDDARVRAWQLTQLGKNKLEEAYPSWKEVQQSLKNPGTVQTDKETP
ncbi:hypothetical protein GCM10023151_20670 [Kangiella marina]|uniref:Uncharacterized protein n=2 Tax=Kangiella marina TaxID=1079178 RepID=A0ABP8INN1_9GAMM